MKSICIKCLKRNECESIRWSPDCYHLDCKDFIPENQKKLFGIFYHNTQTGHAKVLNIFDDEKLALAELSDLRESICKRPSSCINIYIRPCSLSYSKTLADDVLMSIVNCVAQDLLIAERGFKKGYFKKDTFEKSARWFGFAYAACRRGAAILDVINND